MDAESPRPPETDRRRGEPQVESTGGALFLGYFLWGEQQEVTRHQAEPRVKRNLKVGFFMKGKKELLIEINLFPRHYLNILPSP